MESNIAQTPSAQPDWSGRIAAALLFLWILFVSGMAQGGGWIYEQAAIALGDPFPGTTWLLITAGQGLLVLLPAGLLAWFWRGPRYRTVFRLWALAGLFAVFMAPVRLPGSIQAPLASLLQIGLALLYVAFLLLWLRRGSAEQRVWGAQPADGPPRLLPALVIPALLAVPWLAQGALGSPLDSLLALLAGLAFGLAAGLLLDFFWLRPFYATARQQPAARPAQFLLAGFVAGAALLLMASSFGFSGTQLLLALLLPALAWAAVDLGGSRHSWRYLTLLLGLAAAVPLLFVDPREMALAVAFSLLNLLGLVLGAAVLSVLIAWGASAVFMLLRGWRPARAVQGLLLFVILLGTGLVYIGAGHPGFYGDHLFVVLQEQAALDEGLATLPANDVAARRAYVYEALVEHAVQSQAELRQALERLGIDYTPYYLVNGLEVQGGPLLAAWLDSRPEVDRVLYNPVLRPAEPESLPLGGAGPPQAPPWNLTYIGADEVWQTLDVTGQAEIVIGQSDSGVQWDHPALIDSYRGGPDDHDYNWFDPWYGTEIPIDPSGHGTHTLGTVLGEGTGVAPGVTWFACANLVRNVGSPSYYLDCLQFMLAPFPLDGDPFVDGEPALGANILNNSWGCPPLEGCDPTVLLPAVEALRGAGTFVVVSAGNEGPDCSSLDSPLAIYDQAFSVGAINSSGLLAPFSSRGPVTSDGSQRVKPDIVAPGVDILSAYPQDSYAVLEGTSMAGPHVAGVVALMWSANPNLVGEIALTEEILTETARPYAESIISCGSEEGVPTNSYGYGIVDAFAAVGAARAVERP